MMQSHLQRRIRKQARLRRLVQKASKRHLTVIEYLASVCYTKNYPTKTSIEVFNQMMQCNF